MGVEGEPVHDGGGEPGVGESVAPFGEGCVGGAGDGGAFFPGGDDLEQQLGAAGIEGEVADLIEAEQVEPGVAAETRESCLSSAASASSLTSWARSGSGPGGLVRRRGAERDSRWVLPVPGVMARDCNIFGRCCRAWCG